MIALNKPNLNSQTNCIIYFKWLVPIFFTLGFIGVNAQAQEGGYPPAFYKTFSPDIIGPGSNSLLTFTIDNSESNEPVDQLAFTDVLPSGMTISAAPNVTSSCGGGAFIVAEPGGTSITLSDGQVGPGSICTISLYVTADLIEGETVYMNTSGDLTSGTGNSGPATADLTVTPSRPGFSKSFSPTAIDLGETTTLTLIIDNSANPSLVTNLSFIDNLPQGLEIANPANLSSDCGGIVTAASAGSVISLSGVPFLLAGASCTVQVDVLATSTGVLQNTTGELLSSSLSSGSAAASIEVTRGDPLHVTKQFTNDPVSPGGTVDLEFTITNFDRNEGATAIAFSDNLENVVPGLVPFGALPANPCGAGSSLSFSMGILSLSGGSLPQEGSCTFTVTCQIPTMAAPGSYYNTTTAITGTVGGDGVIGNQADADLYVSYSPLLTKSFTNDQAAPGGTVDLEFTITNSSLLHDLTNISFSDEFEVIFQTATMVPIDGDCGAGSDFTFTPFSGSNPATLTLTGGSLAPGASCTFHITLDVIAGAPGGNYTNTTSVITGVVDGQNVEGNPASDDLEILFVPRIVKEFLDDPTIPGDTVELEFTLSLDEFAQGDATNISFTDDLSFLAGLSSIGLPLNDICGLGSQLSGTTSLSFTGGTLTPGQVCSFKVKLVVPMGATIGTHTNTTSSVTATVLGTLVTGNSAKDDLLVNPLVFTKEFLGGPALPGETVTLRFTLNNKAGMLPVSNVAFTDNLTNVLSGLVAEGLPINDVCGTGSSISGTSSLVFSGGNLAAGDSCTFDVPVSIPMAAQDGNYINVTSNLTASIDGSVVILPPANDNLEINTEIISITKEFTDDPVLPGGTVTLEFTIENLDPVRTIDNISFTDDLDAALSGLTAVGLPIVNVCGAGSQVSGTSVMTFTDGTLAPGDSCTFSVTLQLPAMFPASDFFNTTSIVTGMVNGVTVTGGPASDVLKVRNLSLEKAFGGPGVGGGTVDLTFTLDNLQATGVTGINFSDNLDEMLAGTTVLTLPAELLGCGPGAMVSGEGTSTLLFTNGELGAGDDCIFTITVQLPPCSASGQYINTTSQVTASGLQSPPAEAILNFTANGPPMITCPADPAPIELPVGFNPSPVGPNTPQHPGIDPSIYGLAMATDATGMPIISYQDVVIPPNPMNCPNSYQVKRTWKAIDDCDSMAVCVQTFSFFVNPAIGGMISGPSTICPSLNNLPYSVDNSPGVTYNWSFSDGSATINGNGSNQILISFNASFAGGTLSVTATNACGTSAPQTIELLLGSSQFCNLTSCLAENQNITVDNNLLSQLGSPDVYRAINDLNSDATIKALRSIVFKAGNAIQLNPPFNVELGATFIAEIEPCVYSVLNH